MESPQPPTPPNPFATAAAQTQGDVQTAIANWTLANPNQVGPQGTRSNQQIGSITITDAQGHPIEIPQYQVTTTLSPDEQQIFDVNQATRLGLGTLANRQVGSLTDYLDHRFDPTNNLTPIVSSVPTPTLATSFSPGFAIQPGVNMQQAPTSFGDTQGDIAYNVGPQDWSQNVQDVQNALFSRLDPELQRDRAALETSLANQGLNQGDEAYTRAIDAFNRQSNDARTQALLAASQEQSRLANLAFEQGQFNNQAQAQDFAQQAARGQFAQAGIGQNNQANLGAANYGLAAQGQQFGQNLQGAQFGNQALTTQQQLELAAAGLANSANAQEFQQAQALRNQPINEITALMSGGQVSMPNFQPYQAPTIAAPQISSDVYNTANLLNQQYGQQVGQQNAIINGLFGLGSSAIRGAFGRFSGQ